MSIVVKFELVFRLIYSVIFLAAGILKFIFYETFSNNLYSFASFYDSVVPFIAFIIPSSEILIGLGLIFAPSKGLLKISVMLLLCFTVIVANKLIEGSAIKCGCFGNFANSEINGLTLLRNVSIMIFGMVVYLIFSIKYNTHDGNSEIIVDIKRSLVRFAMSIVILFILTQNIILAIQNNELKNRIYLLMEKDYLKEGEKIPTVSFKDQNGNELYVDFKDVNYTVFFIIKFSCELCKLNFAAWKKLEIEFKENDINILYIALDNQNPETINKYVETTFYYPIDNLFAKNYKIISTPLRWS